MNRDDYPEEVSVLSNEMMQRVEAARQARALLEKRGVKQGGIFSVPTTEPADVIDLINLAHWFLTGEDPWADAKAAVQLDPVGNEFLAKLREEQVVPTGQFLDRSSPVSGMTYCPDPKCGSQDCQAARARERLQRDATDPDAEKEVCRHPLLPKNEELAKLEFWGCFACGEVVKNRAGVEVNWLSGDRVFMAKIPGYGHKVLQEGDAVQLRADAYGVLNWVQPDPITDAERERMVGEYIADQAARSDIEKDDVPISWADRAEEADLARDGGFDELANAERIAREAGESR